MKKIVTILLLLTVVLWSCGEKDLEDSQDVNHNADNGYSGITKTDEAGNFISIDGNYPNPTPEQGKRY